MKRKVVSLPPNYFFVCIIGIAVFYFVFPGFNMISMPWNFTGLILMIFGMYLIPASYQIFKKYKTPEGYKKSTYLVTEGLYRYSRNPMYLGSVIFLLGMSVLVGNVLSFVFPVLFFVIIDRMFVPYEEEKGEKEFGKKYLEYKKKVRRWI